MHKAKLCLMKTLQILGKKRKIFNFFFLKPNWTKGKIFHKLLQSLWIPPNRMRSVANSFVSLVLGIFLFLACSFYCWIFHKSQDLFAWLYWQTVIFILEKKPLGCFIIGFCFAFFLKFSFYKEILISRILIMLIFGICPIFVLGLF